MRALYGLECLITTGNSVRAHVHDDPSRRHFLDFVPLCSNCNNNMEEFGKQWERSGEFNRRVIEVRAERYYNAGRYLRSVACYRLLAWLLGREVCETEASIRAIAHAFRPARNLGWYGFRAPREKDRNLLWHPAEVMLRLLEELTIFLSRARVFSDQTCVEVAKSCEIALFECPNAAVKTIELSEEGRRHWYRSLARRAHDHDDDAAALGQWLMYAAMFRTLKEGTLSSVTVQNIDEAKHYWGKNHERMANSATVNMQLATLFDDNTRFNNHWDEFQHHAESASEFNRHTATLAYAEMNLRKGRTRVAEHALDRLVGTYADERVMPTVHVAGFPMNVPNAMGLLDHLVHLGRLPIRYSKHTSIPISYEPAIVKGVREVLKHVKICAGSWYE